MVRPVRKRSYRVDPDKPLVDTSFCLRDFVDMVEYYEEWEEERDELLDFLASLGEEEVTRMAEMLMERVMGDGLGWDFEAVMVVRERVGEKDETT